jgi:tRNA (guanine37-N1)-methyltransferase
VPQVLLSGDHEAIRRWRLRQSLGRTWLRRPELLETTELDSEQRNLLEDFVREYRERSTDPLAGGPVPDQIGSEK